MKIFRPRNVQVGARPGTLAVSDTALESRIRYIDFDRDSLQEATVEDVEALREIAERPSVTWVDVQGLGSADTLRKIQGIFGIHEILLEEVANVPQRPKIEDFEGHLLAVTRMVDLRDDLDLKREQLSIVLGRNYVITFQELYGDVLDPVRERLRAGKGALRKSGADYLAYAILDTVVDSYFPVIEEIGERLETIEESVISNPDSESLRQIHQVRKVLSVLRRFLWPMRDSLSDFVRTGHERVKKQTTIYFRDTLDNSSHAVELVEACREAAGGLFNTYLSVSGNKMNEIMKMLTIMASIFIPLTFLAGIYGMNFEAMPELRLAWAYPALLAIMLVVAIAMLLYFRAKGWIGRANERDERDS